MKQDAKNSIKIKDLESYKNQLHEITREVINNGGRTIGTIDRTNQQNALIDESKTIIDELINAYMGIDSEEKTNIPALKNRLTEIKSELDPLIKNDPSQYKTNQEQNQFNLKQISLVNKYNDLLKQTSSKQFTSSKQLKDTKLLREKIKKLADLNNITNETTGETIELINELELKLQTIEEEINENQNQMKERSTNDCDEINDYQEIPTSFRSLYLPKQNNSFMQKIKEAYKPIESTFLSIITACGYKNLEAYKQFYKDKYARNDHLVDQINNAKDKIEVNVIIESFLEQHKK